MTLLKSSLNTALRNHAFEDKVKGKERKRGIEHYAELGITKFDIVQPFNSGVDFWNEARIRERTEAITNDVLNIWPLAVSNEQGEGQLF